MDHRHREVIKKYSHTLQNPDVLNRMEDSLRKSKIFTVHMLNDIYYGKASFSEELPTRGPEAFPRFIKVLKTNGYTLIAEELLHVAKPNYQVSFTSECENCLILLNDKFKGLKTFEEFTELKRGFTLEATAFDKALSRVGFKNPKYRANLTADELYTLLKDFSERDFSKDSFCMVIIVGFGSKNKDSNIIYGDDGKYILLHEILNLFNDTHCPTLKYKPKIFLLPSFDHSHNDSVENVKLSDVNDTFICFFPSLKIYKCTNNVPEIKLFGQILSENLATDYLKSDFETILKSSFCKFIDQLKENKIPTEGLNDLPKYERLGCFREKILFTSKS